MKIVLKKVSLPAEELAGAASNLELAAMVRPGRRDSKDEMLRWKVACGMTRERVCAAVKSLTEECRAILAPTDTPEWREAVAGKMAEMGEEATAEAAEAALVDGVLHTPAIDARRAALDGVKKVLARRVDVLAATVEWERIPSRVAGGFIRDLLWMFDNVPQDIRESAKALGANAADSGEKEEEAWQG